MKTFLVFCSDPGAGDDYNSTQFCEIVEALDEAEAITKYLIFVGADPDDSNERTGYEALEKEIIK